MSSALEAAIAVPLVLLLVFALLLSTPPAYEGSVEAARLSVAESRHEDRINPIWLIRYGMAAGDSASILSEWVPGLGDVLAGLGGQVQGK